MIELPAGVEPGEARVITPSSAAGVQSWNLAIVPDREEQAA